MELSFEDCKSEAFHPLDHFLGYSDWSDVLEAVNLGGPGAKCGDLVAQYGIPDNQAESRQTVRCYI
jgi:hypothetical protein